MTFLPIVERELREGARKKLPRYTRMTVAAVALIIGIFQVTFVPLFSRGAPSGGWVFGMMVGYAALLCVGSGIFVTADCLSEEKRGGTLGLLFLTDLRSYDIVLGKLAAQLVHLGYALLAIIPGAALPLLLGGVTGGEVWRMSLALINLLLFALAAGVLASALCREAGRAMSLTALILLLFGAGLPLMAAPLRGGPAEFLGAISPTLPHFNALESAYRADPRQFWTGLGVSHLLAWLMIALASMVLPHSWQDRPRRTETTAASPPPTAATSATEAVPSKFALTRRDRDLLESDPLEWLIGRRQGVRAAVWAVCGLWLAAVLLASTLAGPESLMAFGWIGWVGLLLIKVLFASEACRFFATTRRAGAFEFLLATPLNVNRMVSAQWWSLRQTFGPPLLTVALGSGVAVGLGVWIHETSPSDAFTASAVTLLIMGGVLLVQALDFIAIAWLGMWLALTLKKPQLAVGATLLYVIVLPWLTFCYAWFFGFILDIILIAVFASKLSTDLRQTLISRPHLLAVTPQ